MDKPLPEQLYFCLVRRMPDHVLGLSAECVALFAGSSRKFLSDVELGLQYTERTNHVMRASEVHAIFLSHIVPNDYVSVFVQILALDPHLLHCMYHLHDDRQVSWAARQEVIYEHRDLARNRAARIPERQYRALTTIESLHRSLPRVDVGREIRLFTES